MPTARTRGESAHEPRSPEIRADVSVPSPKTQRAFALLGVAAVLACAVVRLADLSPLLGALGLVPILLTWLGSRRSGDLAFVRRDEGRLVVRFQERDLRASIPVEGIDGVDFSITTKSRGAVEDPEVTGATLALVRSDGGVLAELTFPDLASARAALSTLSLADDDRRRTFRGGQRRLVLPWREQILVGLVAVAGAAFAFDAVGPGITNFALMLAPIVASAFASAASVTVGADGITVRRLARRRFYPFSEVRGVSDAPARKAIELLLERGSVFLPLRSEAAFDPQRAELVRAIEVALARYRALANGAAADLTTLAEGDGPYRRAEPTADALLRVVENPAAPLGAREQAARRAVRVDPSARARVRVAAEASADEATQRALEEAAEGEHAEAETNVPGTRL